MPNSIIENRDYTLIVDKSGSMSTADQPGGKTRWSAAQESTLALARKCEQFDPDGITYQDWCSGDTDKQVSVSNSNWKYIAQFPAFKAPADLECIEVASGAHSA